MRHMIWANQSTYETAILIKDAAFQQSEIERYYVEPLGMAGYDKKNIVAFDLEYLNHKAPAGFCKAYLSNLLPGLKKLGVKYIYCADANYFKILTKQAKADVNLGYILPCSIAGFEDMQVVLGINYTALTYNPLQGDKLDLTVKTLANVLAGSYQALGEGIIKWAYYPQTEAEIDKAFAKLHTYPELGCDIETYDLHPFYAGLGTISFSPDQTGGIAFACDSQVDDGEHIRIFNESFRVKLKKFFEEYKGNLTYHKADFDIKVLIYNLWMKDPLDNAGLLDGLEVLTRNFDDTRIIAYLALNSTAGNELGLKTLAHEFAGNWANDSINNILAIPLPDLLQYNVVDTMSTMYVKKKFYPVMVRDGQKKLYVEIMKPSLKTIIQMELTGMPLIPEKVQEAKQELQAGLDAAVQLMRMTSYVKEAELLIQKAEMDKVNAKLKTKQHPLSAFSHMQLNPGSGLQLQTLLYDVMKLPVLDYTQTKQPSVSSGTVKKLINHAKDDEARALLQALIDYSKVVKILSSFIPSFEAAFDKGNGRAYLHGNYNLGGTLSGRLSSSDPNMQQLPSGSKFGKLIKKCFAAPDGWIFGGADFASLEDRINALLTQDPNKIKVYTDGYDGHCLRAYAYFGEHMTDINPDDVASINSIEDKYPKDRQDSKAPTFALTYLGTWMTLVKNCGFSEEKSKKIEENFHRLYEVSGKWVAEKIQQATKDGYGTGAFGLRIRTPLLAKSVLGSRRTLREAEAEGRSLGNAISGQSYGLLTNRASNEFMERVWASPYRNDILPVALIHDAIYVLMRNKPEVVKFVNDNLIDCMAWKGLPEISDPRVPLPSNLDLYWPNWATPITLDNNLSEEGIKQQVSDVLRARKEAALAA